MVRVMFVSSVSCAFSKVCLLLPKSALQLAQTMIAHLHSSIATLSLKHPAGTAAVDQTPTQFCAGIVHNLISTVVISGAFLS